MDNHKRWKLREFIQKLESLSDNGKNDNIPVIVSNDVEDSLYDNDAVKIEHYYSRKEKPVPFVSIDLWDNVKPIDLTYQEVEE